MNEHLLKLSISPQEYLDILSKGTEEAYLDIVPTYKIAECPFCMHEYVGRLDTYSLQEWYTEGISGVNDKLVNLCEHLVITQCYINLHGVLPTDQKAFENNSEVPYVLPFLLNNTQWKPGPEFEFQALNPCAVMHTLPICRIEEGQFAPRFTAFTFLYFAEYPDPLMFRYNKALEEIAVILPPKDVPDGDLWWNLTHWVEHQKLRWLDTDDPYLQVVSDPDQFPYDSIKGMKAQTFYHNGTLRSTRPI